MRRRRPRTRRRILPQLLFVAVVIAVVLLARAAYRSPQVNEWLTHGESTASAGTMHDLRAYARKNGFDMSEYPDELIARYERN